MCGIIGIVGREDVAERLLDGLKRLEYRGYDQRGLRPCSRVRLSGGGRAASSTIWRRELRDEPLPEYDRHRTRWATHGAPTTVNTSPCYKPGRARSQWDHREFPELA